MGLTTYERLIKSRKRTEMTVENCITPRSLPCTGGRTRRQYPRAIPVYRAV